ncbi:hypothetical protein PAMP_024071 [Pampus punctatissimus]
MSPGRIITELPETDELELILQLTSQFSSSTTVVMVTLSYAESEYSRQLRGKTPLLPTTPVTTSSSPPPRFCSSQLHFQTLSSQQETNQRCPGHMSDTNMVPDHVLQQQDSLYSSSRLLSDMKD